MLKMNPKQNIHLILIFSIISLLITPTKNQQIKPINIGDSIKGRLEIDESHTYFVLTIPNNATNKMLIFSTHENKEKEITTDETFSDPDFYISKINKYPSSIRSSEWFSERYGSDVLAIPPESINPGDKFYIGMYCQFKCRYFLHIYFTKELEITIGTMLYFQIKPHETINYKIHIENDFEELNIISYSQNGGKFRIFMNKNGPSSQNTFNIIPSWVNGYSIQVKNKNKNQYCTNCNYYILIQNEGDQEINNLMLYAYFQDKIFKLDQNNILYDAMDEFSRRCYKFDITQQEKLSEKLIIQITKYSGDILLVINGWSDNFSEDIKNIKSPQQYQYRIISEQFIILNKTDYEFFDKENANFNNSLYFCVYSTKESSFTIGTYFLTKIEQTINILTPKNKIRSYLLKDQIMKYFLVGTNIDKAKYKINSDISITTTNIIGKIKSYGYYCTKEICNINKDQLQQLSTENLLLQSKNEDFETQIVEILHGNNYCYKNPNITLQNKNIIKCGIMAIVQCITPNNDNLCIYDIQLNVKDTPLLMNPNQMYFGEIPLGKEDLYDIVITDPEIHSIVVVLNSESGDAELLFYLKKVEVGNDKNIERLISISFHNDYIPDVVRITPQKLKKSNLVGHYLVKVTGTTFSTYSLYYYVTYNKKINVDEKNLLPEVTMNLQIGQIITDYFPYDIRYKIYSFTSLLNEKNSIKIFIDKVNVDFNIYVYKDISNFYIMPFYEVPRNPKKEVITGYDWKNNGGNYILISKNDPKYVDNKMYYIIIAPTNPKYGIVDLHGAFMNQNITIYDEIDKKSAIQFYLGISAGDSIITITEGMPHSMTLNNDYPTQSYLYEHNDINSEFILDINVLNGEIDVFIDMKEILNSDIENINSNENDNSELKIDGTLIYKLNIKNSYDKISLNKQYFIKNKIQNINHKGINLYFYIRRSKNSIKNNIECKYTIIKKSSNTTEELLQPSQVKSSKIKKGESHHYIIEEVKKRKGALITVGFKHGSGKLYVKIPKIPMTDNIIFPSLGDCDYEGESIFSGKIVEIPENIFQKLNSNNIKLQILVTVEAENVDNNINENNEMSYTITYSNEPKSISQNVPYEGYIQKGESQFFNFYFDENVENIYIGLSNMDGDVDMYLNYGNFLPTPNKYDWNSNKLNHEYIDINIKDKFFKDTDINKLSGYYTLLLLGFSDSSYTLFISNHKETVLPLENNKPITCKCENSNDKCYLRYNNVYHKENKNKGIDHNEIIFTTQYLYGNGFMYAKVFKDYELNTNDFYKIFPNEKNYDISNFESNQRNYMKFIIQGGQYTKDSSVLMTFQCKEKTQVDIIATSLRHYDTVDYIMINRENNFYLGKNELNNSFSKLELHLNNFDDEKDLIYSIHSYVGDANFEVYSKKENWDEEKQDIEENLEKFNEFQVISMNYNQKNNIDVYNPYSQDYSNYIPAKKLEYHEELIFKIIPKNEFGFYIQCNHDKEWNNIPIGKSKNFNTLQHAFRGYFDIVEEYSDIELSLSLENNLQIRAEIFIKINVVDKKKKAIIKNDNLSDFSLYRYSYPSSQNYDYFYQTDETLGKISFNINNLPQIINEEKNNKFVRALIYVRMFPIDFEPLPMIDDNDQQFRPRHHRRHRNRVTESFTILLTPGQNHLKYVEANPYEYYYSNLTYKIDEEHIPETKIYHLTKEQLNHELLVIEISSCYGGYEFKIYDQIPDNKNSYNNTVKFMDKKAYGKHMIYVSNLSSKHYYLAITAKENNFLCTLRQRFKGNFNKTNYNKCGNDLSYMMRYYTLYNKKYFITEALDNILLHKPYGKGKIKIFLPRIITRNIISNMTLNKYKFDVFISNEEDFYERMGSVCMLSNYNKTHGSIKKINDVKRTESSLIISGLGYRKKYYINILIQNLENSEMITFNPLVVWSGGFLPYPLWKTGLTNLVIMILMITLVIVIRKYCMAKAELKEIKGETLPKMEMEMPNRYNSEDIKYSGLGESY